MPTAVDTAIIATGTVTNTAAAVFSTLMVTNGATVNGPVVVANGARLEWGGGVMGPWVRVESGGVLESLGTQYGKQLNGSITNAGIVRESGWGLLVANGLSVNLPGGLWDIQDDCGV